MTCTHCSGTINVRTADKAVYEDDLHMLNVDILCPHCLTMHSTLVDPDLFFEYDPFEDEPFETFLQPYPRRLL